MKKITVSIIVDGTVVTSVDSNDIIEDFEKEWQHFSLYDVCEILADNAADEIRRLHKVTDFINAMKE